MKDYFGIKCVVGDLVVYGKSSRDYPVGIGTVKEVGEDYIEVLGRGNVKTGRISWYERLHPKGNPRVIILTDEYKERLK